MGIVTLEVLRNIPYTMARFLAERALETCMGSLICWGHFMTRLAKSYGILDQFTLQTLTLIPCQHLIVGKLEIMDLWSMLGVDFQYPPMIRRYQYEE